MKREQSSGQFLSAVFVDYDNIYLSLKRKSDEAAKRFAKDAGAWTKAITDGSLITATNSPGVEGQRRIVMNRCYGNPVPRRNQNDNSTDMSSFPFVRHHFQRAGFEIIDCPPLTAQLKNSSDIRMVMDVRDLLTHPTYFDEFVILSGDADFTPVLHRLRAHARRTVIFANDYTATPYTAISDGEIREVDLIALLMDGRIGAEAVPAEIAPKLDAAQIEAARREILADVVAAVRAAPAPVPLEVLADRAIRAIGHDRTVGTGWGGAGGFRELLANGLPEGFRLSGEPPYVVIDAGRHLIAQPAQQPISAPVQQAQTAPLIAEQIEVQPMLAAAPVQRMIQPQSQPIAAPAAPRELPIQRAVPVPQPAGIPAFFRQPQQPQPQAQLPPVQPAHVPQAGYPISQPPTAAIQQAAVATAPILRQRAPEPMLQQPMAPAPIPQQALQPAPRAPDPQAVIHHSIARIHEACQAPPLAPPEYRMMFEAMAQEINEHGLIGAQTIVNIAQRLQERGVEIRRDDVRFVLEVVSEADPWFEQGASANLFAGRFRNFVVARCRSQGLNLSADELDLIEAWFAGNGQPQPVVQRPAVSYAPELPPQMIQPLPPRAPPVEPRAAQWSLEEGRQHVAEQRQILRAPQQPPPAAEPAGEDFPRIVRTRLRG